jgi:hypothetical protein
MCLERKCITLPYWLYQLFVVGRGESRHGLARLKRHLSYLTACIYVPQTTRVVWKGCGAERTILSTPHQDISPPYSISREFPNHLPPLPPLPPLPRPTIPIFVPNNQEPTCCQPVWSQSLTDTGLPGPPWPFATRQRVIRGMYQEAQLDSLSDGKHNSAMAY